MGPVEPVELVPPLAVSSATTVVLPVDSDMENVIGDVSVPVEVAMGPSLVTAVSSPHPAPIATTSDKSTGHPCFVRRVCSSKVPPFEKRQAYLHDVHENG
jgi:hypothetical protein